MSTAGGTSLAYVYGGKGHLFLLVASHQLLIFMENWELGLVDITPELKYVSSSPRW